MKPATAVRRLLTLLEDYEWPEPDRQAMRLAIDAMLDRVEELPERVQFVERYVPRPYWHYWFTVDTTLGTGVSWTSRAEHTSIGSRSDSITGGVGASYLAANVDRSTMIGAPQ